MKSITFRLLIISAFFLMKANCTSAQSMYKAGYLVTNNRDTVHGFILDENDLRLSIKIEFKNNINDSISIIYNSSEINEFGFDYGRIFHRFMVKREELSSDSIPIFAKNLIKGKLDLYVLRNVTDKNTFVVINNKSKRKVILSSPKEVLKEIDGKKYLIKDKKYIRLLNYIMIDSTNSELHKKELNYSEKSFIKEIVFYNKKFQTSYPICQYIEKAKYSYDVTVGIPIKHTQDETIFRLGFDRNKTYTEKTSKLSYLIGIRYTYWHDSKVWDGSYKEGSSNYRWQLLNFIPLGVKFQGTSKIVKPYGYFGIGLGCIISTDYKIFDYKNTGSQIGYYVVPTALAGLGVKVRIGSKYLTLEFSPTLNDNFINCGFSF